jgi:hypothetical protein
LSGPLRRFEDGGQPVLQPKTYYQDGKMLVWVVEADRSGAILEDAATYKWFEIESREAVRWQPVTPLPGIVDVARDGVSVASPV